MIRTLRRNPPIEVLPIEGDEDHRRLALSLQDEDYIYTQLVSSEKIDEDPDRAFKDVVRDYVLREVSYLVADIETSRYLKLPLGSMGDGVPGKMLRAADRATIEADVALQLDLPVLNGLPPEMILKVRQEE